MYLQIYNQSFIPQFISNGDFCENEILRNREKISTKFLLWKDRRQEAEMLRKRRLNGDMTAISAEINLKEEKKRFRLKTSKFYLKRKFFPR